MKFIGISSAVVLSLAIYACQNPSGDTNQDPRENEVTEEERLEEPQVRDGMPEAALRDSVATDTADITDTSETSGGAGTSDGTSE